MKNETIELLYNRKSVRAYEKREIPEEDVQKILRAAIEAPTAGNMTLWSAIRVTDEAKKKRLSETCDNQPFIASAPLVLVFCADYKRWYDLFATLDLGEELRKPGRDVRSEFPLPLTRRNVVSLDELKIGTVVRGTVHNVVDFGAFVDFGLKTPGLIHRSELCNHPFRHPTDVISVGDVVDAVIISVDSSRGRVGLSIKKLKQSLKKPTES